MHPDNGVIGVMAHLETDRQADPIVEGLRIHMLDAVDALENILQRFGNQFHHVVRFQAIGADHDIDDGHADLRLFLARQNVQRHRAQRHRGNQQQGRQRRGNKDPGDMARNSQFHGRTSRSPGRRPERISTMSSRLGPVCTTTSPPFASRMKDTPKRVPT